MTGAAYGRPLLVGFGAGSWKSASKDYERFLADPKTRELMASAGLERPPEHVLLEPTGEVGS